MSKTNLNNKNKAAIITVSDKGSRGERDDASGPALKKMLEAGGWEVAYTALVPDEEDRIRSELLRCADELKIPLVLTTGGTGFSPRDVTPEATLSVIQRRTPGIPEAMRAESMRITPMGCLSRGEAGIRGQSLIVNLPGSPKAATENLSAVMPALKHGVGMLGGKTEDCDVLREAPGGCKGCGGQHGRVLSVNVSAEKGTAKRPVDVVELRPGCGIPGDAHAGDWHRQVSLLGVESVDKLRNASGAELTPGVFAENILIEGIVLYELPVGTRLQIGTALCEITQIGKECHQDCDIRRAVGDCVMPREGVFAKVIEAGEARPGDSVAVVA